MPLVLNLFSRFQAFFEKLVAEIARNVVRI